MVHRKLCNVVQVSSRCPTYVEGHVGEGYHTLSAHFVVSHELTHCGHNQRAECMQGQWALVIMEVTEVKLKVNCHYVCTHLPIM